MEGTIETENYATLQKYHLIVSISFLQGKNTTFKVFLVLFSSKIWINLLQRENAKSLVETKDILYRTFLEKWAV